MDYNKGSLCNSRTRLHEIMTMPSYHYGQCKVRTVYVWIASKQNREE